MPDILIIADDLCDAAGCGTALAAAGLDTAVLLEQRGAPADADALALDLDTRRLSSEAAAALSADAVRRLHTPGAVLCKTIDPTLRGNWAAETAAMLSALAEGGGEPLLALVAPACPAAGQAVRGAATGGADLRAHLEAAGLRTERLGLDRIRGGGEGVRASLAAWLDEGVQALACDAETDEDLAALARAGATMRRRVLWAGSAGLLRHLPEALGLARGNPLPVPAVPNPLDPVLTIVGSLSGIARVQARNLARSPGVRSLDVDPRVLRQGPGTAAWGHAGQDLREALSSGDDVLLAIAADAAPDLPEGHALAVALGRLVHEQAPRLGGLVMTGGETARAVLAALGIGAIRLLAEAEPGVPLGLAEGGRPLPVVVKAGAFGASDTLVRCRDRLRANGLPPVPEAGTGRAAPHIP